MCGFWQEADGTEAYRVWLSKHDCRHERLRCNLTAERGSQSGCRSAETVAEARRISNQDKNPQRSASKSGQVAM